MSDLAWLIGEANRGGKYWAGEGIEDGFVADNPVAHELAQHIEILTRKVKIQELVITELERLNSVLLGRLNDASRRRRSR